MTITAEDLAATAWAVVQWGGCDTEHDGLSVVALYTTEQTARQDLDRRGGQRYGYVVRLLVATGLLR